MVLEKKSSLEEMVLSHYAKFMDPLIISQIANLQGIERAIYFHFWSIFAQFLIFFCAKSL